MSPSAILLSGVPPFGRGCYVRDDIENVPWDFLAVNAWRADRGSQVAQARARGATPWLYGTPERFTPAAWREGLAYIVREAESLGAVGVIVDPESGWDGGAESAREAEAFGAACADVASRVRIGVTSFPEWGPLDAFARAAGFRVWGSPQIYGRTSGNPAVFDRWLARWRAAFGRRVAISIAAWAADESRMGTPEGFRAYLDALPASPGVIAWDTAGRAPAYILDALREYRPGGSRAVETREIALALASSPTVIAATVAAVLVVAALAMQKGRR